MMAENILLIILMIPLYGSIIWSYFNIFQWVPKHPLKDVKASGGCHGTGKEFFVQTQSGFRTQLCRGIIDS